LVRCGCFFIAPLVILYFFKQVFFHGAGSQQRNRWFHFSLPFHRDVVRGTAAAQPGRINRDLFF
jgi:hypothetical protein